MKNKAFLRVCLLFFCLWGLSPGAKAQTDLTQYQNFFHERTQSYRQWLSAKSLDQVLRFDSFSVSRAKVKVFLGSPLNEHPNPYALSVGWDELEKQYAKKNGGNLKERLFHTLTFELETGRDSVELHLVGQDPDLFHLTIYSENKIVLWNEQIAFPKAPEEIKIPKIRLRKVFKSHHDEVPLQSLDMALLAIEGYLKGYYSTKGAWWYSAHFDIIRNYEQELVVIITDLRGEILRQEKHYFEYIKILVKAQNNGDNVLITYDLQGKYGSGIFFAPRSSDYKNMEEQYAEALDNYREKMKTKILKILTK